MLDPILNFARVEVSIGYDGSATSIVLASGEGAKLPNPSVDGEFNLVWWDSTNYPNPTDDPNVEIIRVTARSTDTLTVSRNQEGTGASTKNTGGSTYLMILALTKKTYDEISELKDRVKYADSPMIITGGEITEGTNAGTFKVAALTAMLRTTDSPTGDLEEVSLAEQDNQAIASADTTYTISLNYNGGSPTITLVASNPYPTVKTSISLGKVMKDGSDNVHYVSAGYRLQDGVEKLHVRAKTLRFLEMDGGNSIAYSGTNNFTMTEGIVYGGINKITQAAFDSAVTQFTPVYQDGIGGWTEGATRNTIDYAKYDDGDGTLGNVGNAKYGTHWVYRHVDDGHVYVLYGRGSYSLADAETELEPTKPAHLTDFGVLVGKIVAPQAGGSFTAIQMVTDTFFTGTAVSNHANLSNLDYASSGHTGFAPALGADDNYVTDAEKVVIGNTSGTNTGDNPGLENVSEDASPELGGELDAGAHTIGFTQQSTTGDGTTTIDWKLGNKFKFTFGAFNEVFTFTAPTNPCNLLLVLVQDGTGSRTATWPATVKWPGGTAPTLSTGANAVDIISFYWDGTNYHGVASLDFSVPA